MMLIEVRALSPLVLAKSRGSGVLTHAHPYISGRALRGALGLSYLNNGRNNRDPSFKKIFIEEGISFPNLYPYPEEERGRGGRVGVIPLTARSCKYWSGLLPKKDIAKKDKKHGVFDLLLRLALFRLGKEKNLKLLEEIKRCDRQVGQVGNERCPAPLERFRGFFYRDSSGPYRECEPRREFLTRVAIDRHRSAVCEGLLYNLETVGDGECFRGEVRSQDSALLAELQNLIPSNGHLRVGLGKTRGLGKIEITLKNGREALEGLDERVDDLNDEFRALAEDREGYEVADDRLYFSVTLQSDAILTDPLGRPVCELSADLLAGEMGLDPGEIKQIAGASELSLVTGWDAALGVPKADRIALGMGSTFLFEYGGGDRQGLKGLLKGIEERGIGERPGEGFGRVVISDPLHKEGVRRI